MYYINIKFCFNQSRINARNFVMSTLLGKLFFYSFNRKKRKYELL